MTLTKTRFKFLKLFTLFLLSACLLSLPSALNLRLSNDFRVYFSDENPQLKAFDQFEAEFASHDSIALVALNSQGTWLNDHSMALIDRITEQTWLLPFVTRVNSLSNYQYTYADGDTLHTVALKDFVSSPRNHRDSWLTALANDLQISGLNLSSDETVTIIHADINLPDNQPRAATQVYNAINELKQKLAQENPHVTFYLAGSVISNITLEQAVKGDLKLLVPLSYLVITMGLLYFLRSFRATLLILFVVTASVVFTFSIFSLFKLELTPVAGFAPSIVMTLAVADCVHYLTTYRYMMIHERLSAVQANQQAFQINFTPITITSITTAIGVLCLNFSDSPPYRDLGNMVAIGVTLAWLLSISLLPIFLKKFPIEYSKTKAKRELVLVKLSHWVIRHHISLAIILLVTLVASVFGVMQNRATENWSQYFSTKFEVARTVQLLKDKFDRLHRYELVLTAQNNNEINTVEYLEVLEQLLGFLTTHPDTRHIQSYGQLIKRLNQNMHSDDPSFYRMPDSQQLAAQYLLLYELSLPRGLGADSLVNFDRSASRTSLLLKPMESDELIEFEKQMYAYYQSIPNAHKYQLSLSGMDNIFAHIAKRNIISMLVGSGIALIVISILLMIILRSISYGLISLIPNIMPAVMAYGIWGFAAGYIDLALSIVICMSLGIIVDDTVHFLTKYLRARQVKNLSCQKSLEYSFNIVGKALVTTTVILVSGFSILVFSPLSPTANTGALISITIVAALIIDFLLLPIVLYWKDGMR